MDETSDDQSKADNMSDGSGVLSEGFMNLGSDFDGENDTFDSDNGALKYDLCVLIFARRVYGKMHGSTGG